MKTTLKNLAAAVGVDVSTISRALRDDPRVKQITKDKITKKAREMGYTPNLAARSLVVGKSKTIWFMVPSLTQSVEQMPAQYSGIYLSKKKYDLMVLIHNNEQEVYSRQIKRLTQGVADGVIIIPGPTEEGCTLVQSLLKQKYPLVFFDRHPKGVKAACVITDNYQAAFDMISNSYRDDVKTIIDLCSCYENNNASEERSRGVKAACEEFKIEYIAIKNIEKIKNNVPGRIAIIATNQAIIHQFLQANKFLLERDKLLFCCFDQWLGDPYPAQKVIIAKQDFKTMAEVASDLVLKMINGEIITDKVKIPILGLDIIKT